jgi:hypothetical protein
MTCGANCAQSENLNMADPSVRFLALNRDEAKQVFAKKESSELAALLLALRSDETRLATTRNLSLGVDAATYTTIIESDPVLDASAKSLLTRGGRLLPSAPDTEAYLIRPDLVAPLSVAAASIGLVGSFLANAAANRDAVMIVY